MQPRMNQRERRHAKRMTHKPMPNKNYGYRPSSPHLKDWRFGGPTGLPRMVLAADGQWDKYLPESEYQNRGFETYSCVSQAALNCLETLAKQRGEAMNGSDRFLAKTSGTTKEGNSFWNVCETIRTKGVVQELSYPFGGGSFEDFYQEPPKSLEEEGRQWVDKYEYGYEFGMEAPDVLKRLLTYGPLEIAVHAWGARNKDGHYIRTLERANHAVMLYGYEDGVCWKIFDSYWKETKTLTWDFLIAASVRHHFALKQPKPMPTLTLPDDTLVQLVEGSGGFGLHLKGKIIVDDLAKVLASWQVRNGGDTKGKVVAVTLAQWQSLPHCNLKMEPVNE